MTDARTICDALSGRWHGGYGLAFCPCHENTRTPALSLKDGDDDRLLVHCFAGCDGADVLAALRTRGRLVGHSDWRPDPREIERRKAEEESERRRKIQRAYNTEHGITPQTVRKRISDALSGILAREFGNGEAVAESLDPRQVEARIGELRRLMLKAASELDFETAVKHRDEMRRLEAKHLELST